MKQNIPEILKKSSLMITLAQKKDNIHWNETRQGVSIDIYI